MAVVSNCVDPFWNVCAAGARAKADELGIEVEVVFPDGSAQDQKQKLEDLRIRGVDGIAVSALDASGLNDVLNAIAAEMPLITQDSDAPGSDRVCFIGVDNYAAGRVVGKLVKEACPDGGKVAIFIGRLEQQNSRDRRQGVIDELLDRDFDSSRFDEVGSVPKGGKYEVIGTLVDNSDQSQAKASAEDTLTAHPDLACMVGLFAYNPPNCLEAARSAGKLGEVKIVGFDEDDVTLEGIEAGTIYATVSQNPYEYGSESVRVLNALCDGDKSVIPAGGVITVPSEAVRKDNVVAFRKALEERRQGDQ
ncbi:D-ribose-binding periplasmic protein precursor [Planctomycetes bacterium Poly30]|uniref:D-ribose-binding periplasmic protein n=1 Tax=Saltatorellus ferox TaxID=2528018 RepID=A0A518ESM2_9BACT|nr:D-ribose-binding periplasmic protein precursor [Planctomycetes bacterium Poly30]